LYTRTSPESELVIAELRVLGERKLAVTHDLLGGEPLPSMDEACVDEETEETSEFMDEVAISDSVLEEVQDQPSLSELPISKNEVVPPRVKTQPLTKARDLLNELGTIFKEIGMEEMLSHNAEMKSFVSKELAKKQTQPLLHLGVKRVKTEDEIPAPPHIVPEEFPPASAEGCEEECIEKEIRFGRMLTPLLSTPSVEKELESAASTIHQSEARTDNSDDEQPLQPVK
jgi:hypothetical protein